MGSTTISQNSTRLVKYYAEVDLVTSSKHGLLRLTSMFLSLWQLQFAISIGSSSKALQLIDLDLFPLDLDFCFA